MEKNANTFQCFLELSEKEQGSWKLASRWAAETHFFSVLPAFLPQDF